MEARSTEGMEQIGAHGGSSAAGSSSVRVQTVLPAPRSRVFHLLTEPWEVSRWWGPDGFTVPSIDSDPSAGGRYRIAMQPPDGKLFHLQGEFLEVDPPGRISYTLRWDDPGPEDVETVATLTLRDADGSTDLTVEHAPFMTKARRTFHERAWTDGFEKLRRLLAG